MMKHKYIPVLLTLMVCMVGHAALADTTLNLQINPHQTGGRLQGNITIGHGQISTTDIHGGFHVWGTAEQDSVNSNVYIIQGKNNPNHRLRIRLGKEGWQAAGTQERGIYIATTESGAGFDIVSDGSQMVYGDEYTLSLTGTALK